MSNVLIVESSICDNQLELVELSLEEFREKVNDGVIVVIKSVFSEFQMIQFRKALLRWTEEEQDNDPTVEDPDLYKKNYHRSDINPPKAKAKRIFHEFNLNDISELPDYLRDIAYEVFSLMLDFQNWISGVDVVLVEKNLQSAGELRLLAHPQVMQYPCGGGFFQEHTHPYLPQKFGLILNLSSRGKDFHTGGTRFWSSDDRVIDVEEHQKCGDITVFRYDLLHGVTSVDANAELKLKDMSGRWVAVLPYYSQKMIY